MYQLFPTTIGKNNKPGYFIMDDNKSLVRPSTIIGRTIENKEYLYLNIPVKISTFLGLKRNQTVMLRITNDEIVISKLPKIESKSKLTNIQTKIVSTKIDKMRKPLKIDEKIEDFDFSKVALSMTGQ